MSAGVVVNVGNLDTSPPAQTGSGSPHLVMEPENAAPQQLASTPATETPPATTTTATMTTQTLENTLMYGKRYGFKDVDDIIQETYNLPESSYSTICDIMAMYLAGQKILYTEAKTYCEQHLNFLMLPAIAITALCTILSLVLKELSYGATIVSSLNGINAFILALINYLKLDAKAEAHRTSAYKFDKIQAKLVFNSGKILFIASAKDNLGKLIEETENDVRDIKETNQFILPEHVRFNYPNLYSMNVFVEVKKIQNLEMMYINELKDIFNDIYDCKTSIQKAVTEDKEPEEDDLSHLGRLEGDYKMKMNKILELKNNYLTIDSKFDKEMKTHRERVKRSWGVCGWLKT